MHQNKQKHKAMAKYELAAEELDKHIKELGFLPALGQPNVYKNKNGKVIFADGKFFRQAHSFEWVKYEAV